MRAVRFCISSRLLVFLLAALAALGSGVSCQKKTEAAAPVRKEKPPAQEMVWEKEQQLGGVAALPAAPVLVKEGLLPLVYLNEQAQKFEVHDVTGNEILAEFSVGAGSIVRIDERAGVAVGRETFRSGPLDAKHRYGIFMIPQSENTSQTGSLQHRKARDATPAEAASETETVK